VGIYPGGATALGVHDLSGNVWEWTLSLYRPYRYQPGDGRNDPEAEGQLVGRGGSWSNEQRDARCAFRDRNLPDSFFNSLGFRVVVSLANSEC
jgi:formylglycine-generating enzyme required for sulfatase activity